jgi:hypothetical protein
MTYQAANTDWFAQCRFGIAAHWTAQSMPVSGPALPFAAAVAQFPVAKFLDDIQGCGAAYLLFTITHALQMLPAPSQVLDRLLPGRTCQRDLLAELAAGCTRRGLKLILYYNHSCNAQDDPDWQQAVGYHGQNKQILADNLSALVSELGGRYGSQLAAWWFDSAYSLDPSGPYQTVTTDMRDFRFPWEDFSAAAKHGHPGRLVTFNPGMRAHERLHQYSTHQDYLAGEVNDLCAVPTERWAANGLQNHRWVCLDNSAWVHHQARQPLALPRYPVAQVAEYLRAARAVHTPVTFNVDVDQCGQLSPESLRLCARLDGSV